MSEGQSAADLLRSNREIMASVRNWRDQEDLLRYQLGGPHTIPLEHRIRDLERRIAELEARHLLKSEGS